MTAPHAQFIDTALRRYIYMPELPPLSPATAAKWTVELNNTLRVITDDLNRIYVESQVTAGGTGPLYAYSYAGDLLWQTTANLKPHVMFGGYIWCTSDPPYTALYAVDPNTGAVTTVPLPAGYENASSLSGVNALDPEGVFTLMVDTTAWQIALGRVVGGQVQLVQAYTDKEPQVLAIDRERGRLLWTCMDQQAIYYKIVCAGPDGQVIWEYTAAAAANRAITNAEGRSYVVNIYPTPDEIWAIDQGPPVLWTVQGNDQDLCVRPWDGVFYTSIPDWMRSYSKDGELRWQIPSRVPMFCTDTRIVALHAPYLEILTDDGAVEKFTILDWSPQRVLPLGQGYLLANTSRLSLYETPPPIIMPRKRAMFPWHVVIPALMDEEVI